MSPERYQFLFGSDEAPFDVDDDDQLAAWFAQELASRPRQRLEPARALMRVVVARHVLTDTPPATWLTARRLLDAGLDRSVVLDELTMAVMIEARYGIVDESERFDDERYTASLALLPLPTVDEIEAAVERITSERQGMLLDDLTNAVLDAVGRQPDDELAVGLVDRVIEHAWDDGGRLVLLAEDQVLHLPSATAGAVLTHRVNESELEIGALSCVGTDLALFAWNEDLRLPSGEAIETYSAEPGHAGWLGPEEWLSAHAAGDLIEVRLVDGVVHIGPAIEPAHDAALAPRVAHVHAHETEESGLPVTFLELAAAMVLDDADTFSVARLPLTELCLGAGLEIDGGYVASGPEQWARREESRRFGRVYDAAEDAGEARAVLHALELVEGHGSTADLRSLLREWYDDPRRATLVLDELVDPDLHHGDVEAARGAAGRLVEAASRSVEKACAHWFAALVEERAGSVLAADAHVHLAALEDPSWGPAVDRAGWYASDRGDAATALRWWRELETPDRREVAAVSRHAQRTAPRVGRNDPCWCGSGRKFKSCHQGRGEATSLPDRVEWLWAKAVGYVLRRGGEMNDDLYELTSARALDPDDAGSVGEAMDDPIVFDTALVECGWFERFVKDRGAQLPDDEALLAASWDLVERTVYEVEEVGAGGLVVRDLRTAERLTVEPPRDAAPLQVGVRVCARAVPDGRGHQFVGARFPVAPGREDQVIALCDDEDADGLCEYVAALSAPPHVQTREGEEIVECETSLTVPDRAEARRVLDLIFEADDEGWAVLHDIGGGERIVRATMRLVDDRLTVRTNAVERMERVQRALAEHLPGSVVVESTRTPLDTAAALRRGTAMFSSSPVVAPDVRAEIAGRLEERWLDESVPALGGLTPRQAAADPTRRDDVTRLLATFPRPDPDAPFVTMDPRRLRDALGL